MGRKAHPSSGPGAQLLLTSAGRRPGMEGKLGSSDGNTSKGVRTATKTRGREMAWTKVLEQARSQSRVWCRGPISYLLTSQVVLVVKNLPASAGDTRAWALIPGSVSSPGEENGNPPQYSCLEDPVERRAWQATAHGVSESGAAERTHMHSLPPSHICLQIQLLLIHCYLTLSILSLAVPTGFQENILHLFVTT